MTLFADLATLAERLAAEPGKLAKRAAIAAAIARIAASSPAEAGLFCLYLAGQPFAETDLRRLNAGGAILSRVLQTISAASGSALAVAYRRHGDLGAAAYDLLQTVLLQTDPAQPTLTLADIAAAFDELARARTTASRSALLESLLRRATPLEAKYLLKLILGDMRIGVQQSLVEEAIAEAAHAEVAPALVASVRHAVMLEADLARAVERAFAGTLADARMTLFHPLGFMLASPVETPEEAIARFSPKPPKPPKAARRKKRSSEAELNELPADPADEGFAADIAAEAAPAEVANDTKPTPVHAFLEDKYDGIRAQLHCLDPEYPGRVALYSRNREDITESFPELEEAFAALAPIPTGSHGLIPSAPRGLILDGEILAWDVAANRALPFAVLGQRLGRKRVDPILRRQVPVIFMAFDLLFADGELLLPRALSERRAQLEELAARLGPLAVSPLEPPQPQPGLFAAPATSLSIPRLLLSPARLVESAEAIDTAYKDARARANEGVMIKAAGSLYQPGRRGLAWVKLKRELATLDVVITGAEFGHGRRAGLLSDYTFAVRGPAPPGEPAPLLNVGKAYSGVTDAEIAELTAWLKAHTLEDHGHFRTVEPLRVLEVAFNNIMRSDRHASGFALRFPRILRLRDDKPVSEIDTLARVEEIYASQPDRPAEPEH